MAVPPWKEPVVLVAADWVKQAVDVAGRPYHGLHVENTPKHGVPVLATNVGAATLLRTRGAPLTSSDKSAWTPQERVQACQLGACECAAMEGYAVPGESRLRKLQAPLDAARPCVYWCQPAYVRLGDPGAVPADPLPSAVCQRLGKDTVVAHRLQLSMARPKRTRDAGLAAAPPTLLDFEPTGDSRWGRFCPAWRPDVPAWFEEVAVTSPPQGYHLCPACWPTPPGEAGVRVPHDAAPSSWEIMFTAMPCRCDAAAAAAATCRAGTAWTPTGATHIALTESSWSRVQAAVPEPGAVFTACAVVSAYGPSGAISTASVLSLHQTPAGARARLRQNTLLAGVAVGGPCCTSRHSRRCGGASGYDRCVPRAENAWVVADRPAQSMVRCAPGCPPHAPVLFAACRPVHRMDRIPLTVGGASCSDDAFQRACVDAAVAWTDAASAWAKLEEKSAACAVRRLEREVEAVRAEQAAARGDVEAAKEALWKAEAQAKAVYARLEACTSQLSSATQAVATLRSRQHLLRSQGIKRDREGDGDDGDPPATPQ